MTMSPERTGRTTETMDRGVKVVETPFFLAGNRLGKTGCCLWDCVVRSAKMVTNRYDVIFVSDHLPNVSLPYLLARMIHPQTLFVADWADLFTDGGVHEHLKHFPATPFYYLSHWLEQGTKRWADLCTATSRPLVKKMVDEVGIPKDQVLHLPSGCDSTLPLPLSRDEARIKLGLPLEAVIIGRTCSAETMFEAEITAFLNLWRRYRELTGEEPLFYFVGPWNPKFCLELSASGCPIRNTGRLKQEEVAIHLAACDLFVMVENDLPFHHFRGPIRLNDYLMVGRPIICNSVGDHVQTLKEHAACVVVDDFSIKHPVLDELLTDSAKRQDMGRRARLLAEGELSWKTLAKNFDEFLQERGAAKLTGVGQGKWE